MSFAGYGMGKTGEENSVKSELPLSVSFIHVLC